MSDPVSDSTATPAFPPTDLASFLAFCAGEWLALRSSFALGEAAADAGRTAGEAAGPEAQGDEWHSSERGELKVSYLAPQEAGGPGGLAVTGPGSTTPTQTLMFSAAGNFESGERQGQWQLWPDGSLELVLAEEGSTIRERIWFTKPNLRLRSSIEHRADGSPGRASFSSEIRRVGRPATESNR